MKLFERIKNRLKYEKIQKMSFSTVSKHLSEKRGLLVLCYHTLESLLEDYPFYTSIDAFDQHLNLINNIFDVQKPEEAIRLLVEKKLHEHDKPVAVITFDDGFRDNLYTATPLLEKHELPAQIFIVKEHVCNRGKTYMDTNELISMSKHPLWKVGAHSVSHDALFSLIQEDLEYEIRVSRDWISEITGDIPEWFAYPQGKKTPRVISAVKKYFNYAYGTEKRIGKTYDQHQIRRLCIKNDHDDINQFARHILFSIWESDIS